MSRLKQIVYIIVIISVLNNFLITFEEFQTLVPNIYMFRKYFPDIKGESVIYSLIEYIIYFIFFQTIK